MLEDDPGSKRPLSMISFEMNTTSRRTANRCSFNPRIISPSTKAAAGAFLISSLIPQACLTIRRSKSLYFSKMRRVSSRVLPELRTASAHLRNSGYRPPWLESSSLAISCWERCSRLPFGATRASTKSEERIVVSTRHPLRQNVDRNIVLGAQPHLDHIGIGQGDAAVGPVVRRIIGRRMLGHIGQSVNHDGSARRPTIFSRPQFVVLVRVAHLDGKEIVAARVATCEEIASLRRPEVVLPLFGAHRAQAQGHLVFAQQAAAIVQIELVFGLVDDDMVGGRNLRRKARERRYRPQAQAQSPQA